MKSLDERVLRLQAVSCLQRIMASYSYYLSAARFGNIMKLFSEGQNVSAAMPWGTYRGPEELRKLYFGLYGSVLCGDSPESEGLQPGVVAVHGLNTPKIEVADDCLSAEGTWNSPGLFTVKDPQGPNGLRSYWCWQKISGVFVFENGVWKIRSLRADRIFTVPFEVSWTDYAGDPYAGIPAEYLPDGRKETDR